MTSATSTDDGALVKTATARGGFSSLPLDVISTHVLRSDFLPEPGDLRSLRAVSKGMRDAVDATGREIKKMSNLEAAELGYLSLLKERRTRGLPSYFWEEELRFFDPLEEWESFSDIETHARMEELKRRRKNHCPWDEWTCVSAAKGGHLEILKWLRANDCPWDERTCSGAAYGGHLEVLRWARENGCPWGERTCAGAAKGGHLEVLKWARANDCPWNEKTCKYAAYGGHLNILKWARENDCPWDKWTCAFAAEHGHLEVLNGCARTTARGTSTRARARRMADISRRCCGRARTAARGTRRRARGRRTAATWRC
jgi:hypothetical protein